MSRLRLPSAVNRRKLLTASGLLAPLTQAQPAVAAGEPLATTFASVSLTRPQAQVTPSLAVIALNRIAFGPRPGDPETSIQAFNAFPGATEIDKLSYFIERQLDPAGIADSDHDNRLAGAGFTTLNKTLAQLWLEHRQTDQGYNVRILPAKETERVTFLRAVYSRRQLQEILADFWHNHFSVYGWDGNIGPVMVHYDRDCIRAHSLGNFRQMLEAVAKSTAMLYYLDNYLNTNADPNENFAREAFELHTLGAEHYLGSKMLQSQVPRDGNGQPIGYVDQDVYEATRCFTGWTYNQDTGLFQYNSNAHDRFQKTVLGRYFIDNQGPAIDGTAVLDLLAEHPGTAVFISRKLCHRLIGDTPPENVVQSAAQIFTAQQAAPDQLRQVVRHILQSEAFRTIWGQKVKRPFEATISALRATNANLTFGVDDGMTNSFMWTYEQAGQKLFNWRPPDGYPDRSEAWENTTSLLMRWRLFNWLVDRKEGDLYIADILGQTGTARSANELVDHWSALILGRPAGTATRQRLVEFMAEGQNADTALALETDNKVKDRLRSMVALILMSPDFQWR